MAHEKGRKKKRGNAAGPADKAKRARKAARAANGTDGDAAAGGGGLNSSAVKLSGADALHAYTAGSIDAQLRRNKATVNKRCGRWNQNG